MRLETLETRRVLDSTVVFNEVMYNPVGPESGEWIELHNQMSVDVELSDWTLEGAVDYRFPAGTILGGGEYLVVAANPAGLRAATGLEDVWGPFAGRLSNGGERIELRNHTQRLMNSLDYGDGQIGDDRWPVGPDGSGATLAKRHAQSASEDPANWRSSEQRGGTPGTQNFFAPGALRRETLIAFDDVWRYDQSGRNLRTGWREPDYDDSDWSLGAGVFSFEDFPLFEDTKTPLELGVTTYYFRTTFELAEPPTQDLLRLYHLVDDGAIFYLNGHEVERHRMRAGTATSSTFAAPQTGNARPLLSDAIDASLLQEGINTLAVEVHQSSVASDDVVFGAELWYERKVAAPEVEFDDVRINEVGPAGEDFWIEITNSGELPVSLQSWQLTDDDGTLFTFPADTLPENSQTVVSAADLGVETAAGGRWFLWADHGDRLIDAVRVGDSTRARAPTVNERWQSTATPTPGVPNRVDLAQEIVINEIMYHAPPTYAEPAEFEPHVLVPYDAAWQLNDHGQDVPGFADVGFDDSGWDQARGMFRREGMNVPWAVNRELAGGHVTTYLRQTFDVGATDSDYAIEYLLGDGAVFYLNGQEFLRIGMPDGAVTAATQATATESTSQVHGPFVLPSQMLTTGTNVLAVELHRTSPESLDVAFGLQISEMRPITAGVPFAESEEEWIELYNRSDHAVNLAGWQLFDAVDFTFPTDSWLAAGEYAVVVGKRSNLAATAPEARVLGAYDGRLSNFGERLQLLDERRNIADEVHYFEGGYWPTAADGGGASLELADPFANNFDVGAWRQSDESSRTDWQHVQYTTTVGGLIYDPPIVFAEFMFALLDAGIVLVDNVSVQELRGDSTIELIQNGSFDTDELNAAAQKWRMLGTHERSQVVEDPDDPENRVLRIEATARASNLSNHIETTFLAGGLIEDGKTYAISYDARWVEGSPQLHSELHFRDGARTEILRQPDLVGTPGRQNSVIQGAIDDANVGPTFFGLKHEPAVPRPDQSVHVSVSARDNDEIQRIDVLYRPDGVEQFASVAMQLLPDGRYAAELPPQSDGSIVQFYVVADDGDIATMYPPDGPDSRALYKVREEQVEDVERHVFEMLMLQSDVDQLHDRLNMMDNQHRRSTFIHDNSEVFYDTGTRLRGSMFTRDDFATGYNVRFRPEQLYRGVHDSVGLDQGREQEIVVKFINLQSGNYGGSYDDAWQIRTPSGQLGRETLVYLARNTDIYLEEQFGDDAGTVFKMEGVRTVIATEDEHDPESPKLYRPIGGVAFDIADLGSDKERYRWPYLINGNRAEDDYSGIIAMAKAFSAPDDQLEQAVEAALDMDSWTKTFALMSLFGIGDVYTQGGAHNLAFLSPHGGPVKTIPWDWDWVFNRGAFEPLHGGTNLARILDLPTYDHLFLGQLNHLIDTVFNVAYMRRWLGHFGEMLRGDYSDMIDRVARRGDFVKSQLPRRVPFVASTSNVEIVERDVVTGESAASFLLPTPANGGSTLGDTWKQLDFAPSDDWSNATASVGFGGARLEPFIDTPIPEMRGTASSIFLRVPFEVDEALDENSLLFLKMRFDDGFVASINGVEVARVNAPDHVTWESAATSANFSPTDAQTFDVTQFKHLIQPGANVLAIQGLNTSIDNADALFDVQLAVADVVASQSPVVTDQDSIQLSGVGWVDIHQLRLKGQSERLPLKWSSATEWFLDVPLEPGENRLELQAYGFDNQLLATQTLHVTSTLRRPAHEYLRVSELMYHPSEPSPAEKLAGVNDDRDFEFIEFVNSDHSAQFAPLSLAQYSVSGAIDYQFPDIRLAPGERIVLAADPTALALRYGDVGRVIGPYDGVLSNAGEGFVVKDPTGSVVLELAYDDSLPWPRVADGFGASLVAREVSSDRRSYDQSAHWRASTEVGGSPGRLEQPEIGVVINEVLSRPTPSAEDAIELYNRSVRSIDLSGWLMSDDSSEFAKYVFPQETVLGAGEYLVVTASQFDGPSAMRPFGLSGRNGDSVFLVAADASSTPTAFVDEVHFGASRVGESFGRLFDPTSGLAVLRELTLGFANSTARQGPVILSEVHYHAPPPSEVALAIDPTVTASSLEFVELTNVTEFAVDLTGWRLDGGVRFDFDAGMQIEPSESMVIVTFDPADPRQADRVSAFREEHQLSTDVRLVGGLRGGLNNREDQIQLLGFDGELEGVIEDAISYRDESPWPLTADGRGASLHRLESNQWGALASAWLAARPTPGRHDAGLFGDLNDDQQVDSRDIDRLCADMRAGTSPTGHDLNGDGVINEDDLTQLVENILESVAGDADLNGRFDSEDIVAIFVAGQYNDDIESNSGWATGDWNCDGDVDSEDLVTAFIRGGYRG